MSHENITRVTAEEIRRNRAQGIESQTDWARVDALTDDEIKAAMRDDPDSRI
jgi:hypothetical protein